VSDSVAAPPPFADARILIIDDEPSIVKVVTAILARAGYLHVHGLTDGLLAETTMRKLQPDLILLDLRMPNRDGLQVLDALTAEIPRSTYLPIVMLTGDDRPEIRAQALARGARDFLHKPFDRTEVLLRIQNLLETRGLHRRLEVHNRALEERVKDRTRELEAAQLEVLQRLAGAGEYRDDDTGLHTARVATTAATLATAAGLDPKEVDLLTRAAPLHDVGKIGIPDSVLLKPGKLTADEMAIMRRHTIIGARILEGSRSPLMQLAEAIALRHHERFDGTGYPNGLSGDRIPLPARIVAVADVFDALTHARPYRPAWTIEATLAEISRLRGSHFDPSLTDLFLSLEDHGVLV
jgi:putative two-component system response regulator